MSSQNLPMVDIEAQSIIDEIRNSFSDVKRGPLSPHQANNVKYATPQQLNEFGNLDVDDNWAEIPDQDIEANDRALYGADPESWRYFLPAWMIWSLRSFRTNDLFIADQIIYTFDPRLDN